MKNWFFMLTIVRNLEKRFHRAVCKAEADAEQKQIAEWWKTHPYPWVV